MRQIAEVLYRGQKWDGRSPISFGTGCEYPLVLGNDLILITYRYELISSGFRYITFP